MILLWRLMFVKYLSVTEIAKKWGVSERSVRNYCAEGRIKNAILVGKTWAIPRNATKPLRKNSLQNPSSTLLDALLYEKRTRYENGVYHMLQVNMTYQSLLNFGIEFKYKEIDKLYKSRYSESEKLMSYELTENTVKIKKALNHFNCIDTMIENARKKLSVKLIREFHKVFYEGMTIDECNWSYNQISIYMLSDKFTAGRFKEVEELDSCVLATKPEDVSEKMKAFIAEYNKKSKHILDEILNMRFEFDRICPFEIGNRIVGQLILVKECLRNNIVPIMFDYTESDIMLFYYSLLSGDASDIEKSIFLHYLNLKQTEFKKELDKVKIKY